MYIALDPRKAFQFTTKGVRLTPGNPVAHIPDGSDDDVLATVNKAIQDGIIYRVPDDEAIGIFIPGIGKTEGVSEEETKSVVYSSASIPSDEEPVEVTDFFGKKLKLKKRIITFKIPEETRGEDESKPLLVLTDRG